MWQLHDRHLVPEVASQGSSISRSCAVLRCVSLHHDVHDSAGRRHLLQSQSVAAWMFVHLHCCF